MYMYDMRILISFPSDLGVVCVLVSRGIWEISPEESLGSKVGDCSVRPDMAGIAGEPISFGATSMGRGSCWALKDFGACQNKKVGLEE